MEKKIRLDKFLAEMGAGSRSQIKEMAKKGNIQVNGRTVKKTEEKIDPNKDLVFYNGSKITYVSMEYYMLNKPQGVVSATEDNLHETVIDLLRKQPPKTCSETNPRTQLLRRKDLFPVGRLDLDTEGLLLITNDGELAHKLLSPKKHVDKRYYALVSGILPQNAKQQFEEGICLFDGTVAMPAVLEILGEEKSGNKKTNPPENYDEIQKTEELITEVILTVREGKFHQVKRMFQALGCKVLFLKRLSMGKLVLDETLKPGEYRPLFQKELDALKSFDDENKKELQSAL